MGAIKEFRTAARGVPEITERARESLTELTGSVRRANATMTILAIVAVVALGLAVVAIQRRGATRA